MDDLEKMIENKGKSHVERVPNENFDQHDLLKKTTGLNIDPTTLPPTPKRVEPVEESMNDQPVNQVPPQPQQPKVNIPSPEEVSHIEVPSAEDKINMAINDGMHVQESAEKPENEQWVKLSAEPDYTAAIRKRQEAVKGGDNDILAAIDENLQTEGERLQNADAIMKSPEARKEVFQGHGPSDEDMAPKVKYEGNVSTEKTVRPSTRPFNPVAEDSNADVDVDDLLPSYYTSEEEEEMEAEKETPKADENEAPDVNDEAAYSEYIRNLEVAKVDPIDSVVRVVKNRQVDVVPAKDKSGKFLGDQSFLNAINRFKRDNFTVISVPLVNSGFIADVVGTGEVDLTQLYTRVSEQTSRMDYDIEKMRTIIKNVVGTHPRIDAMQLRNKIHYRDFDMLAWGHICATLDTVEIVTNCDDCGKPFRITSSPRALLMNMDEMLKRQKEIEEADDINRYSLLVSNRKITTSNLFEITIGHPTYAEIIQQMGQLRKYATDGSFTQIETNRFINMADVLYQVRLIKLPNGVVTSNIYQVYHALNLLSEDDFKLVEDEIVDMRKEILEPKFGIAAVTCPHCGHAMHDIPYDGLDDLVFFHTMVSRMMNTAPTPKSESK